MRIINQKNIIYRKFCMFLEVSLYLIFEISERRNLDPFEIEARDSNWISFIHQLTVCLFWISWKNTKFSLTFDDGMNQVEEEPETNWKISKFCLFDSTQKVSHLRECCE